VEEAGMPRSALGPTVTALLTVTWACTAEEGEAPPRETAPAAAQSEPVDAPTPPTWPAALTDAVMSADTIGVLGLLSELRDTPTARVWAGSDRARQASLVLYDVNPYDEGPPFVGVQPRWCLRGVLVDSLGAGIRRRRQYFFYHDQPRPEPPSDFVLPPMLFGIDYQYDNCTLRMVAVEIRGDTDLPALRAAHADVMGEPTAVDFSAIPYGLYDRDVTTWRVADVTVAVGPGVTNTPVAMAFVPIPAEVMAPYYGAWRQGTLDWRREVLDLAIEAAELDPGTRAAIDSIRSTPFTNDQQPDREMVLSVLRTLVARPDQLIAESPETERYAARLSVADLLLTAHYPFVSQPQGWEARFSSPIDAQAAEAVAFNELGADYVYSEFGYRTAYRGSFSDSLATLPGRPGGWVDIGRLVALEEGCDWDPTLEFTTGSFLRVTEPRFLARMHYLRAEALASMIAIHRRGQLRPGVVTDIERVRLEALGHYRSAIANGLGEVDREHAWHMGWSVATNNPLEPRYECGMA